MSFATYTDPRPAFEAAQAAPEGTSKTARFCLLWRAQEHRLLDGTRVVPDLSACISVYRWLASGAPYIPLAITEGTFTRYRTTTKEGTDR